MEYGLVVLWLAAYLSIGALALPLAASVFPRFHDRGAAFAIPLGLLAIAVVGYLVGHLAFGLPALLAGLAVLAGLSLRADAIDRTVWRSYTEIAVVFAAAFLFMVSLRAVSPAIAPLPISAGEKFLDYGLLRSLLRANVLPPEDMWFAGEAVQYYYGGQMLTALLTTLTGTAPRFAYNLALAGFYATLVTATYGLAGAIASDHGAPRRPAATVGAFFVGVAGNLHTAVHVVVWALPTGWVIAVPGVGPDIDILSWTPSAFFYWDASRVIEGTINEFPLFAWLNGDLHAHMLTMPFTLLVAGLCYSYWQTPEAETERRGLLLLTTAPAAGFLAITNTWDFPVAGGLVFLTVAFAPADPATLLPDRLADRVPDGQSMAIEELRRDGLALAATAAILLVGGLLVAPFWLSSASTRSVGLFPPRSDLWPLFVVHGGFLLLFVPYIARRTAAELEDRATVGVFTGVGTVAVVVAWLAGFAAVALFGPLLLATWLLLRRRTEVGFETLLVLAGIGLALIVEFAYVVEPHLQGTGIERLNTVFKVYSQLWVLWAPAAGVVTARMLDPREPFRWIESKRPFGTIKRIRWRPVGLAVVCVAVAATGLYAGFAVPAQYDNEPIGSDGPTLDGETYTASAYPDEAAAIAWLDDREGQPTIVTAAPGGYRWDPESGEGASAPSSLTGIPTVLGWMHEEQYRGSGPYEDRLDDVTTIYEGEPERQAELLEGYEVTYVYVGPAERAAYELTIEEHPRLHPVFERGDVVVYEVR